MSAAHQCDRCKVFIAGDKPFRRSLPKGLGYPWFADEHGNARRMDLCADCSHKLVVWLYGEAKLAGHAAEPMVTFERGRFGDNTVRANFHNGSIAAPLLPEYGKMLVEMGVRLGAAVPS